MTRPRNDIFTPPNLLKAKLGGTVIGLDSAAIARAEAAVEELSSEFIDWMRIDIERLTQRKAAFAATRNAAARQALTAASRDLRIHALTLGFPLVARAAASLSTLLARMPSVPASLLDAHVDAIQAMVREGRTQEDETTALQLVGELETQTAQLAGG